MAETMPGFCLPTLAVLVMDGLLLATDQHLPNKLA
jgi:hypothetical protein